MDLTLLKRTIGVLAEDPNVQISSHVCFNTDENKTENCDHVCKF